MVIVAKVTANEGMPAYATQAPLINPNKAPKISTIGIIIHVDSPNTVKKWAVKMETRVINAAKLRSISPINKTMVIPQQRISRREELPRIFITLGIDANRPAVIEKNMTSNIRVINGAITLIWRLNHSRNTLY